MLSFLRRILINPFRFIDGKLALHYLKGANVYCPVCDSSFITFLPSGRVSRANARCPKCDSLERHRLQFMYIQRHTTILTQPTSLLHVAPESHYKRIFCSCANIQYRCIDKFTVKYNYPEDVIDMDITELKFSDESFDVVICNHVLEHVHEDSKAMKEIFRVLRKGGMALLQVPLDTSRASTFEDFTITDPMQREKLFGQFDHVRVYGKDYKDRLESAGFSVRVVDLAGALGDNAVVRYGLMPGEELYICTK